ncbi:MAG: hypothetical protein IAF38_12545 [Bacteroidia bacterium]|nr:hypothetical protein [Bacteroidia bacterium]
MYNPIMFPEMLKVFAMFKDYQFVIAGAPALELQVYEQYMGENKVRVLFGKTYQILNFAQAGIITSGTATLETALFNVPQVVCYKTGGFAYWLGRKIVNFTYASLVNLILNRPVLKELLQNDMNAELIAKELRPLLTETPERKKMLEEYETTRKILGGAGVSERIAKKLYAYLTSKK